MLQIPTVIMNGAWGWGGEEKWYRSPSLHMDGKEQRLSWQSAHVGSPALLSIGGGVALRPAQGPLDGPSVTPLSSFPIHRLPSLS